MHNRIRELRTRLGLSQRAFAEPLGVSRSVIANIEYGRVEPTALIIKAIGSVYGVSEQWLLTGEGPSIAPRDDRPAQVTAWASYLAKNPERNAFALRFAAMLSQLDADDWALLERMTKALIAEQDEERATN